jgi:hypothetical protein
VSTSPLPAVASAGVPDAETRTTFARRRHQRVGAFQEDDAAEALGSCLDGVEPAVVDVFAVEQPRELPRMRCEHARRGPVVRLEVEQRIRVDHDRHLQLAQQASHERALFVAAPETGTDLRPAVARCASRSTSSSGAFTASSTRASTTGSVSAVRRDSDVPGVGAERGLGRQAHGSGHSRRADNDEYRARAVFRVAFLLALDEPRISSVTSRCRVSPLLDADVGTASAPAGVEAARAQRPAPTFGACIRHGHVRGRRPPGDLAGQDPSTPGRKVDGDDRHRPR